jgi:hypothetical protein
MVKGAMRERALSLRLETGMLFRRNRESWLNVVRAKLAGVSAQVELFD